MTDTNKLVVKIQACHKFIIENLSSEDHVADSLHQCRVFSQDDLDRVMAEKVRSDKIRKMMSILCSKPQDCHPQEEYMEALKEDNRHIYDKINDCDVSDMGKPRQSDVITDRGTFIEFLHNCIKTCLQLDGDKCVELPDVTGYLNRLSDKNKWDKVTDELTLHVIKSVFGEVQTESDKLITTITGVTWKQGVKGSKNSSDDKASANPESPPDMSSWRVSEVSEWLRSLNTPPEIIEHFEKHYIDGIALKQLTVDPIMQYVCPGAMIGPIMHILSARDSLIPQAHPQSTSQLTQPGQSSGNMSSESLSFQSQSVSHEFYEISTILPPARHDEDPLSKVQLYCMPPGNRFAPDVHSKWLQRNAMEFASSCVNERRNGTLYVGVSRNGQVIGISAEKRVIQDALNEAVHLYFYADEAKRIGNCIKHRFIPVKGSSDSGTFVMEIDINAEYDNCEKDVFWLRNEDGSKSLLRFKDGISFKMSADEVDKFMATKNRLALQRRQVEEQEETLRSLQCGLQNQSDKLKLLLCRGGDQVGDVSPILVTNCLMDEQHFKERFYFLKQFEWKYILDFDNKERLYSYLDSDEQQVLRVHSLDELTPSQVRDEQAIKQIQDSITSTGKTWIFVNGRDSEGTQPYAVHD